MRIFTLLVLVLLGTGCGDKLPTTPSPPTTFNLAGVVRDTVLRPVNDAKVEIMDGPQTRQFTTTDEEGRFTFPPFTAPTPTLVLRVTRAEYSPLVTAVANKSNLWVTLNPLVFADLKGQYTIMFTADNACGKLPASLRTRTYTATTSPSSISQTGAAIALSGGDFVAGYDTFWSAPTKEGARFHVFSLDAEIRWMDAVPILERLDSTKYLSFMGRTDAAVVKADGSMEAALDGTIAYCAAANEPRSPEFLPSCSIPISECMSNLHQLTLTRR
jgi:hypothetical protein